MPVSASEYTLKKHYDAGTLTHDTIAQTLSRGNYLYTIHDIDLKNAIYCILLQDCTDTTTTVDTATDIYPD